MSRQPKVSKKQLLKVIGELERSPHDRIRILGEVGISTLGIGLGAAAAGTVASVAGVTSIPVLTTAASWVGVTAVAATPLGWALGTAAVGGVLAYGVSRWVRGGAMSEGRKQELLLVYQERLAEMEVKERAGAVTLLDKSGFISSLREVIEKDVIGADKAFRLIEAVEVGTIALPEAYRLINGLLQR
ncbi:Conserved membrane protein [Pseudomonas sp. IT-194MI4]|uniref:hypothetical protein n=1 Tax=Pseudomonas sp. IT-194MI4 TaxID=3026443 RepID=UPI0039E1A707